MVLFGFPFLERRKLLRDCREQADNHTNRCRFHFMTEFADNLFVLDEVSYGRRRSTE